MRIASARATRRRADGFEALDHTGLIGLGAVLAQLALALDTVDDDFDPDDRPQLLGDERVGRIVDLPHRADRAVADPCPLVTVGQVPDEPPGPRRIVVHHHPSVDVDDLVVPGRHDPGVLGLRRVPRRRHVAVGGGEDDEGVGVVQLAPVRVHARQVTAQGQLLTVGIVLADDDERQRTRHQAARTVRHEMPEARRLDHPDGFVNRDPVGGRVVHVGNRSGANRLETGTFRGGSDGSRTAR